MRKYTLITIIGLCGMFSAATFAADTKQFVLIKNNTNCFSSTPISPKEHPIANIITTQNKDSSTYKTIVPGDTNEAPINQYNSIAGGVNIGIPAAKENPSFTIYVPFPKLLYALSGSPCNNSAGVNWCPIILSKTPADPDLCVPLSSKK